MTPDGRGLVDLVSRCLLVENLGGKRVLFEAGIGTFFEPKLKERYGVRPDEHVLRRSLERRGFSHEDVDAVVLSHLHFDHAGGLLSAWREGKPPELLFPRAKFLVSAPAWERAKRPHARDRASFIPDLPRLLEESGRLETVEEGGWSSLGPAVRFRFSHGHTPGMVISELGGDGGAVFCSDLAIGRAWVRPAASTGYDRFPELLIDEKNRLFREWLGRRMRLFFTHDPGCALAALALRDGKVVTSDEAAAVEGMTLG